jgi:hypothetical protein
MAEPSGRLLSLIGQNFSFKIAFFLQNGAKQRILSAQHFLQAEKVTMAQRGRKSAASLLTVVSPETTSIRPRLSPMVPLTSDERAIFALVVAQNPHLTATDMPLLTSFAQASVKVFKLSKRDDTRAWERACRVQAMFATKLRLTAQSAASGKVVSRNRRDAQPNVLDQYLAENPEDDDQ